MCEGLRAATHWYSLGSGDAEFATSVTHFEISADCIMRYMADIYHKRLPALPGWLAGLDTMSEFHLA